MIRDPVFWQQWEAEWQRRNCASLEVNFRIFWTLLEMAREANAWPPRNPLEGLDVDIRLAHAINYGRLREPSEGAGPKPR